MTLHAANATPTDQRAHQRAVGQLAIYADTRDTGETRLARLRQQGSFRAIFPKVRRDDIEAVMINTAGGITGGDAFTIDARAEAGSALTLTTQAAERIYRASGAQVGSLETTLTLGANARLNWLPQETILFEGCALRRRLNVTLETTSTFLMVEPLVFGRRASGEVLRSGQFQDSVTIMRDGMPLYHDGVRLAGDIAQTLASTATGNGAGAMASVVFHAKNASDHIDPIRALLAPTAGASMLADDLLVLRLLSEDGYALRQALLPILTHLTDNAMPKNWRL